jgi:hypothetical protein
VQEEGCLREEGEGVRRKRRGRHLGAVGGFSRSSSPWVVVLTLALLPWARS